MEITIPSIALLTLLFLLVAFAYSSVGLGGGSSYIALMTIVGINVLAIPVVALSLNLVVTTAGSFNFIRARHARLKLILPFLISSIPMSYLGGMLRLPNEVFYWLLLISLTLIALRIFVWKKTILTLDLSRVGKIMISLMTGTILGLIAGIVGIGGGIYLVPLIIVLGLGTAKEAAACGAIFVWLNSLSGLTARLQYNAVDLTDYVPLFAAVLVGGVSGSFLGSSKFTPKTMEKLIGAIIIVAILFLLRKIVSI